MKWDWMRSGGWIFGLLLATAGCNGDDTSSGSEGESDSSSTADSESA